MNIPLVDLKAHHEPIAEEIHQAIERVFRSQIFILGPEVKRLEEQISAYCRIPFAIGVSSGTDALLVSLMALGVGHGDEVLTTPYSFFATAGVIARVGAKPVFVDIDPSTFNIDPSKIEEAVTSKTKVMIPVHLYGQCADMGPILKILRKHQIQVVEDAAQAIGAQYRDGNRAGTMGDLGCFSFFPSKNLGALGDAGMVITSNQELAERVRMLRVHGSKPKYYHQIVGGNFRLDALQAAILNQKFNYLDSWTQKRRKNAKRYETWFKEFGLTEKRGIQLPRAVYKNAGLDHDHIYNQFVIRAPNRDSLREHLRNQGISTEVYYPVPLHLQECFRSLGYKAGDFPEAERAAKESLALPIYPELTDEMQKVVVETIRDFYGRP